MSPDPDDNEDARIWFNCVEEMVFSDDDFCSDTEPSETNQSGSVLATWRKLQALQASYIVCLYQNWEGTDACKRRIRRHRFSTVVSVSGESKLWQRLGLTNGTRSQETSASKQRGISTIALSRCISFHGPSTS